MQTKLSTQDEPNSSQDIAERLSRATTLLREMVQPFDIDVNHPEVAAAIAGLAEREPASGWTVAPASDVDDVFTAIQ